MDSTFSRTGPATQKSLSECGRNSGGSCFVLFVILELLTLLWEKRQLLSKHCHQHCYWELEDPSFSSDLQCKLTTLHPKWITSCASWLLSVHLDLLTTFLLLVHLPTDLVLDFCSWWFLPPYYWRRHHSSGHCDPRGIQPSWCGFTSTPFLLYPDSAQTFIL